MRFLGLDRYRGRRGELPVAKRLSEAIWALREWRDANGQDRNMGDGELNLGVRVVADALAGEIAAFATAEQDASTVAWVLAGLRCPAQPFCTGCRSCQTVTAPHRLTGDEVVAGG
jgi:hypothetical protein